MIIDYLLGYDDTISYAMVYTINSLTMADAIVTFYARIYEWVIIILKRYTEA